MSAWRMRKARRAGCCAYCGGPLFTGMQVAEADGETLHVTCALKMDACQPWSFAPTGTGAG